MGCCNLKKSKKRNSNPSKNQATSPDPPVQDMVPSNFEETFPNLSFFFKPIPNQRKAYLYNIETHSVYQVPVSIPFKFRRSCGISFIENNKFFISGGYESEDDMSKDSMLFDISSLSGEQVAQCPISFVSATLLYYSVTRKIYLVGGIQSKTSDSGIEEFCDYKSCDFYAFDLATLTWEALESPPKQYCLSTSYLKDGTIFLSGGFSSILDDGSFIRKTDVFTYNISEKTWKKFPFDYTVPVVGSQAFAVSGKILVLGGLSDINTSSSKVFLLSNTQVQNLADFQSPNLAVLQPPYVSSSNIFFLSEPDMLINYSITHNTIDHESLINSHSPLADFYKSFPVSNPRSQKLYVYFPDLSQKLIKDFNVISHYSESHYLKSVQFRDSGVAVLSSQKIFVAGGVGVSSSKETNLCFLYNPINGEEKEEQSLPIAIRGLRLIEHQGVIYAISGFSDTSEKYEQVFCYSFIVKNNEWISLTNMFYPTRYSCCFVLKENLFAIGGEIVDEDGETTTDHVQVFDLETKVWSLKVVKYPQAGKKMGFLATKDQILIFGGEDNEGNTISASYLFDGEQFLKKKDLPDTLSTYTFDMTGLTHKSSGFIFTDSGVLLKINLESFVWEEVQTTEEPDNRL